MPRTIRRPVYGAFARIVGANTSEAELSLDEYPRFVDFFTRRLRPGSRHHDVDPRALASPCDGRIGAHGRVTDGTLVQAKGRTYRVADLLADERAADRFRGGSYLTVYLSPADYHRVHAPLAARWRGYDHVPGRLWPVSPLFSERVPGLYSTNERVIIHLDSAYGAIAVVMIAAWGVGHVALVGGHTTMALRAATEVTKVRFDAPREMQAGDELAMFLLGSTVVLVADAAHDVQWGESTRKSWVRCGATLARLDREGVMNGDRSE